MDLTTLSQNREGTPAGEPAGERQTRDGSDLVTAAGQLPWPPAGSYLAASGQFHVAVVITGRASPGSARTSRVVHPFSGIAFLPLATIRRRRQPDTSRM